MCKCVTPFPFSQGTVLHLNIQLHTLYVLKVRVRAPVALHEQVSLVLHVVHFLVLCVHVTVSLWT